VIVEPLPDEFTPHTVLVRDFLGNTGMGSAYGPPRPVAAFAEDEQKTVRSRDGAEVVSTSQVHLNFGEAVPLGSLVTVWPGMPGEREAEVLAIGRHQADGWPAFQTLSLA
jgi:hypothetical protein